MLSVGCGHPGRTIRATLSTAVALVVLSIVVCFGVGSVGADDAPSAEPADSGLAGLTLENLLDIKVTTASKKPQTLSDSPASVFLVDRTDIYRYGYQTLADALRNIVGIYTSTDRGFDYIGVRGYSPYGDYNGRVLLMIDGHRVNDPIYDTAPIGAECPIDMEDIERIEVIKGPGSSLWGTNALLATINIITRTGGDAEGLKLSTTGEKHYAQYGSARGKDLDVVASVTRARSDGQKRIYFPEFDSPDTNNGVAHDVDGTRAIRSHLAVSRKGLRLAYIGGDRSKTLPTAAYGTILNDPGTVVRDRRRLLELSFDSQAAGASKNGLFARVFSDMYDYMGDYAYDYPPRVINRDHDTAKWWGAELRLSNTVSDALSVTYGVDYQRVGHMRQCNYDVDPYQFYYAPTATQTTRSAYSQVDYQPSDLIHLTLGTRYDNYSSFGANWSPRAALVYSPSSRTSIKALYGTAFRAPNLYELAWADSSMPATQPEKIWTKELVWEQRLDSNSRLIASLFSFEIKDIIAGVETEDSWYITNRGSANSNGFEMQYETRSNYGTRGYAGICMTRVSTGEDQVFNSPDFVFTAGASVPVLSHRYYVSPQIRTVGRVFSESRERIGAGTVVDVVVTTAGLGRGTAVSMGIYDLLGATVYSPASAQMTQGRIPQPGRTLRLTVSRQY